MQFSKSDELRKIAPKLIPGGAHTYSKGDDQFPQLSPGFIVRGKGSQVWDVDGNQFVDWGMGLRTVILGHAYEPVLEAVKDQLALGTNFTRPSPIEAETAQLIVDLIPSAEMVKFCKNGSDATTAAVKLARAHTGRNIIVRCLQQPFFSVDDWFIGDTVVDAGIPDAVKSLTKNFNYNDIQSLEKLFAEHAEDIACVILEPAATEAPNPGFLQKVREITEKHGAVLIFDEMISGFRWSPKGAQDYYGVTPDLSTFGKAIANGFACAAIVGKREIMELGGLEHDKPRVFLLSSTNGGETHALAAAKASMQIMQDGSVSKHLWEIGGKLVNGFNQLTKEAGLHDYVSIQGIDCSPFIAISDGQGHADMSLRALFLQEMIKHGVLIPYIAPSLSHTESELSQTLEALSKTLPVLAQAVEQGTTEGLLVGPAVKPVFRKFN